MTRKSRFDQMIASQTGNGACRQSGGTVPETKQSIRRQYSGKVMKRYMGGKAK